jgi:hypothetical protein
MIVVIMIISDDCCLVGLFYSSSPAPRLCELLYQSDFLQFCWYNLGYHCGLVSLLVNSIKMIISDDCCLVGLFYSSSPAPRLCEILLSPSILVSGVFNISHFDSLLCNFWVNWNQTLEKWCFWGLIQTVLVHDLVNTWHYILLQHWLDNQWCYNTD